MTSPKPGTPMISNTRPLTPRCPSEEPTAKSFKAFRVVIPDKENSPNFILSGALSYYSFTLGVGLLILGSILTFVLNDQSRQIYDPFNKNLTVTAILLLVIGSLLITSTVIKCLYPCCLRENNDAVTDVKFETPPDTEVQPVSDTPENNTILYNPFYPPILVPSYTADKAPQMQGYDFDGQKYESYNITFPKGNINLPPGTLIYAEENLDKEKIKELECQLIETLEAPEYTAPADENRSNGSAIRGREQILQVDDFNINQLPKF